MHDLNDHLNTSINSRHVSLSLGEGQSFAGKSLNGNVRKDIMLKIVGKIG